MSVATLRIGRSTFDRFAIGMLVLLACFGQPNVIYLVVPFFYPLLAAYFLATLAYFLASDDFVLRGYVRRLDIGMPLAVFFTLAAVSVFYAAQPAFAVSLLISAALKVMMFYVLLIAARSAPMNRVVARVIVAAAVFFSATGLLLFLGIVLFGWTPIGEFGATNVGGGLEYDQQLRFYGLGFVRSETSLLDVVFPRLQSFFAEPGYFAFFLELSLFATLYCKHLDSGIPGRARQMNQAAALQVIALMLSLSLGAVLAIAGGLFVFLFMSGRLRWSGGLAVKGLVVVAAGVLLWPLYGVLREPLTLIYNILVAERFETAYGDNSADTRLMVFRLGLDLVEERPLFGWGFGQVRVVLEGLGVNNSFLTVFAELGIFGLVAYLGVLLAVVLTLRRSFRLSRPLGRPAVLATAALSGMFAAMTLHSFLIDISWSFIYWLGISLVYLHHRYLLTAAREEQRP
jgi:O-antigen ligase